MQDSSAAQSPQTPAQKRFYASDQCAMARQSLQRMVDDQRYETDSAHYRLSEFGFVERHLHYLSTHPIVNVDGYLSNLRLMTEKRG